MFSQVIRSFTSQFPTYVLHVRWETGSQCAQRSESLLFPINLCTTIPQSGAVQSDNSLPASPPPKKIGNQAHPESVFCAYVPFVNDSRALSNDVVAPPTFLTAMTSHFSSGSLWPFPKFDLG